VSQNELYDIFKDPFKFFRVCWPELSMYDKQADIVQSILDNDETFVPAGNQLGKDFIAAFITVWFFCSRVPSKIVTIAPGQTQLETVLWGEIRKFIQTSSVPLPIKYNHLDCKFVMPDGSVDPQARMLGIATNKAENVQGQHLVRGDNGEPSTLALFDEASGVDNQFYDGVDAWSHRRLIIGNPLPCTNFFFQGVSGGDIEREDEGYHRKVLKIKASDSPNVRLALAEIKAGKEVSHTTLIPGVVSYNDYNKRRKLWDAVKQCIGLDAEFYAGAEVLLFPPEWLNASEQLTPPKIRKAKSIGVDPAEGGDNTVWTVIDKYGIIEQISLSTQKTNTISNRTIVLLKKHNVEPSNVLFDIGGGGKQHADQLRERGYDVRTVAFGGAPTPVDAGEGKIVHIDKKDVQETRTVYKNKRAQLYGDFREILNPENGHKFGIPPKYTELRRQLAPLPLLYDAEGRLYLPPKDKPTTGYKGETIRKLLGCSPDEADSTVLALHGMLYPAEQILVGAIF